MSKVFIEEATLTAIGDALRSKEGTTELVPVTEMAERIEAIGGNALKLIDWATTVKLTSLNVYKQKNVVIDMPTVTTLDSFCSTSSEDNKNTVVEDLTINCPNRVQTLQYMLNCSAKANDTTLKKLTFNVDISSANGARLAFSRLTALEEIDGTPLNFTNVTSASNLNSTFSNCYALREVRFGGTINVGFKAEKSPLSKASILSLISCLSSAASGQTLTLSLNAVNTAYETSEGLADGSTSAEWLALVAAHSNWTISLV